VGCIDVPGVERAVSVMRKILITGANGFIGSDLCIRFQSGHHVAALDHVKKTDGLELPESFQADISDFGLMNEICMKVKPDIVIHCAGIAHQKAGSIERETYFRINSDATRNLALAAGRANPWVKFIFLSSVSVYGEDDLKLPVSENHGCNPTSDYGLSKLDAENGLLGMKEKGGPKETIILRLAPVYDREWSLNLDRRVMAPFRIAYLRFGSGDQEMSALARPNLTDFIQFLVDCESSVEGGIRIFNVCDVKPYTFHEVMNVFRRSGLYPSGPVFAVPLPFILVATKLAAFCRPSQKKWIHACYKKVASSLVFDNTRMLGTGFAPLYSLKDIYRK
jgi:nucleoside-diphosphate-sugar epimerase